MKKPNIKIVFDRKKVSDTKHKGLVQFSITFEGKRAYVSTGVKVYSDQWDNNRWVIRSVDMIEQNNEIREQRQALDAFWKKEYDAGTLTWERLKAFINHEELPRDFLGFLSDTIEKRNNIRESTRKVHRKLVTALKDFSEIKNFGDLTKRNILAFDNYLHGRKIRKLDKEGNECLVGLRQQSIYGYHKLLRTYIHLAMQMEMMDADPYTGLHFQRGESEPDRFLTEEELHQLEGAEMRNGSIARARDLFVFQAYTGLSYADMAKFDFSRVEKTDGVTVYRGVRVKTGEPFFFVLMKPALEILKKYDGKLPVISAQSYNNNLKKAAQDAGLNKPLASHWARRTAAVTLANHGVSFEIIARVLGHASVATTEAFYARLMNSTVVEAMKKTGLG